MDKKQLPIFTSLFFLAITSHASTSITTVYGLDKGVQHDAQPQKQYQLIIGTYRSYSNAQQCRQHYQTLTKKPIHIKKSGNYYTVVLGPFHGGDTLRATSQALLSGSVISPVHTKTRNTPPVRNHVTPDNNNPIISLSAGAVWIGAAHAEDIRFQDMTERTYSPQHHTQDVAFGELFFGGQKNFTDAIQGQAGIAFYAADDIHFAGNIWDDKDPEFNNFRYQYTVSFR